MVYTELAPKRQQFHVAQSYAATKERYQYTTSVDIKNTRYKKKKKKKKKRIHSFTITYDMCAVSHLESREKRYTKGRTKHAEAQGGGDSSVVRAPDS